MSHTHPHDGNWTLEQLLAAEAAGEHLDFLMFWGHTAPDSSEVGPHVLSQWWPQEFEVDGQRYVTAEHFMMAEKARLFGDDEQLAAVLASATPKEAKACGRKVKNFDSDAWDDKSFDIVTRGSVAKFAASQDLAGYLVGTGHRVIVEASPVDPVWGIGLAKDAATASAPSKWKGRNLLGFALMSARAQIAAGARP